MGWLTVAALVWIACHVGLAGTRLRSAAAGRLGDAGFRAGFSILSVLSITWLIIAYRQAPFWLLWIATDWLRWLIVALMAAAFLLFTAAVVTRSPTAVGGDAMLTQEPRGVLRVTRHPMLWSFALWAALHILGNGDAASLVFFGAFLITALAGMPSIDAKIAARDPRNWPRFAALTSILPFQAIIGGRNRLVPAEIGWLPLIMAVVLWAALLLAHPWIFGVNALPTG